MTPFGGFFFAAHTEAESAALLRQHDEALFARWPEYHVRIGKLNSEGLDTLDPEFLAYGRDFLRDYFAPQKNSFRSQGLGKPGIVINVQATPGSHLYSKYGDQIRTYTLGETAEGEVDYHVGIENDDTVVSYGVPS